MFLGLLVWEVRLGGYRWEVPVKDWRLGIRIRALCLWLVSEILLMENLWLIPCCAVGRWWFNWYSASSLNIQGFNDIVL